MNFPLMMVLVVAFIYLLFCTEAGIIKASAGEKYFLRGLALFLLFLMAWFE